MSSARFPAQPAPGDAGPSSAPGGPGSEAPCGKPFGGRPCAPGGPAPAPRACIIYSSRTGNTRKVAEHLASAFHLPLVSVQEAVRRWGGHAARRTEGEPILFKDGFCTPEGFSGSAPAAGRAADCPPLPRQGLPAPSVPAACSVSFAPASPLFLPEVPLLVLGFWMWRGGPDGAMLGLMRRLRGRDVFVFGTMAAWPDSPHAQKALTRIRGIMAEGGNRLLGHWFCQGRLDPAVLARSHHPHTPERLRRLEEAARHPDIHDLHRTEAALRDVLG